MVLRKLAISSFLARRIRFALTVAAIALSVSLVVSVTSGYESMEAAVLQYLTAFMGRTDVHLSSSSGGVPPEVLEVLRADAQVEAARPRLETTSVVFNQRGRPISMAPAKLIGVEAAPENLPLLQGAWFKGDDGDVAVIDQVAARAIKGSDPNDEEAPAMKVGESFELPGVGKKLRLRISGIVRKPAAMAAAQQTIYIPIRALQRFIGDDRFTRTEIELKAGVSSGEFVDRMRPRLLEINPLLRLRTSDEKRRDFDTQIRGARMLSYMGGMVSMLAAAFIVFSTLAMGVNERQRTLAILRAVGAQRGQLGRLVILEGLILCGAGIAIGVPLGLLWVSGLGWIYDDIFTAGVVASTGGMIFAILACLATGLLASFLPAWSAMRVSPLEAMSPLAEAPRARVPVIAAIFALVLIPIDSFLLFAPWEKWLGALGWEDPAAWGRAIGFYGHFFAGLPGIMIGFFLLSPMIVWITESVIGPVVAWVMGIRFALLRQQLSGGIWRAAGTCAALMVGLAILVVMQTQGRTMIGGWQLPTQFPDLFIVAPTGGLDRDQQQALGNVQGIKQILPMAIAYPGLGKGFLNPIARAVVVPDATMFFGIDPDLLFKMMKLDFRDGNPEDAAVRLKQGRHVIITEELRVLKGLRTGSKLMLPTLQGEKEYTVAGVVWSPGIDVMVSLFDLDQQFEQRTAFSIFGTLEDASRDFGEDRVSLFAVNVDEGIERKVLMNRVSARVRGMGLHAGDVRHIKAKIEERFRQLLLLASTVAFAAMAVASLGVTNTIMASIRTRRWQFGILRSIGVTRGQLLRMVIAESILLGVIGCALGLAAGLLMAVNAKQLALVMLGYNPPMQVPWDIIVTGAGIVVAVTLLASIFPARNVANTEVLELLQAGRAAT